MTDHDQPEDEKPAPLPDDNMVSWNPGRTEMLDSLFEKSEPYNQDDGVQSIGLDPVPAASTDGEEAAPPPCAQPFGGRFTLGQRIGTGGFGEVWEGVQDRLGRPVALKLVRRDLPAQPGSSMTRFVRKSFQQEAYTAAALDHPGIVPIYDMEADERGLPTLAMKLVRGRNWYQVLAEDFARMPAADFYAKHVPVLESVAQAVAFAHSRGIVHRDLKPGQVMLGDFGEVLLMDWGLGVLYDCQALASAGQCFHKDAIADTKTATNPAGTVGYMAPEQTESTAQRIGPWTDVYLLGGTLYHLLTGSMPHEASSVEQSFRLAQQGEPAAPRLRAPGREMPPELVALCEDALQADPEKRPRDAHEFLARLQDYLGGATRRQRSRELAATVEERLHAGTDTYRDAGECRALLEQASERWPENPAVQRLKDALHAHTAGMALAQGDLQLARMEAESMEPGERRDALMARAQSRLAGRMRRERQRRVAVALTLVLAALIVAGTGYYNRRLNSALESAWRARTDAERLINSLVDNLYERLQPLGHVGILDELGASILSYYCGLGPEENTGACRMRHATSLMRLQQAKAELGRTTAALQMARESVAMAEELIVRDPNSTEYRATLADARMALANTLFARMRQNAEAREAMQQARNVADALARDYPARADFQARAARAAEGIAMMDMLADGNPEKARTLLAEARLIHDKLTQAEPENTVYAANRTLNLERSALADMATGRPREAAAALAESVNGWQRIVDTAPANASARAELARALFWQAMVAEELGRMDEAEALVRRSLDIRRYLADRDPDDVVEKWHLAVSSGGLADVLMSKGDLAAAERQASATLEVIRAVPQHAWNDPEFQYIVGLTKIVLARLTAARGGDAARQRQLLEEALAAFRELEKASPHEFYLLDSLAEVLLMLDRRDEAGAVADRLRAMGYTSERLNRALKEKGLAPLRKNRDTEAGKIRGST